MISIVIINSILYNLISYTVVLTIARAGEEEIRAFSFDDFDPEKRARRSRDHAMGNVFSSRWPYDI